MRRPYARSSSAGEMFSEHRRVAERALGKPLLGRHPVHHVNESPLDNRPCNLVICESNAYHKLLHGRLTALRACGHASWRKCTYCQEYDDTAHMLITGHSYFHRAYMTDLALQYIADQDRDGWLSHAPKGLPEEFCRHGLLTRDIDGGWAFTAWGEAELRRRGWKAPWWTWRGFAKRLLRWREGL